MNTRGDCATCIRDEDGDIVDPCMTCIMAEEAEMDQYGDVDYDMVLAEAQADAMHAQYDDDPSPYSGTYSEM